MLTGGSCVGLSVGVSVGLSVGTSVGLSVGASVGLSVGASVGSTDTGFPTLTTAPRYEGLRITGTLSPSFVTIRLAFALSSPSPIISNGIA